MEKAFCARGEDCQYQLVYSVCGHGPKTICSAYSWSKRADGKDWAHFPACLPENCPLVNSDLLEGAILSPVPSSIQ